MKNEAQVILKLIGEARSLTQKLQKQHPQDAPWPMVLQQLDHYESMIQNQWPLNATIKEDCKLGWFSSRNIEEVFPDLHDLLSDISYKIRNS